MALWGTGARAVKGEQSKSYPRTVRDWTWSPGQTEFVGNKLFCYLATIANN